MTEIHKPNQNELLMMKALDNELTKEEKILFESLLNENDDFKKEWENYKKMKTISNSIQLKKPESENWDLYWQSIYNKLELKTGMLFLFIGLVMIISYAAFHFFQELFFNSELSLFLKVAISFCSIGLIILFISVLRERLNLRKSDKYKDIIR